MVRLFSINFWFQNEERLALVSIRERGLDFSCQVRYVDKYLNNLLCGKQFVFSLLDGLQQPADVSGEAVQNLLRSTVEAVKRHLDEKDFSPAI